MKKWIIFIPLLVANCDYISIYPDSPLEELAEQGIERLTGLDIDLSSEDGKPNPSR